MNKFVTAALLSSGIFLAGCAGPQLKYADLHPFTTAAVHDHTVTIHLGNDPANPTGSTRTHAHVVAGTVYVTGHRTPKPGSQELVVRLSRRIKPESVVVIWVQPDGSLIPIPPPY